MRTSALDTAASTVCTVYVDVLEKAIRNAINSADSLPPLVIFRLLIPDDLLYYVFFFAPNILYIGIIVKNIKDFPLIFIRYYTAGWQHKLYKKCSE